ncbi:MAG: HAMP domain-containing histidine kinase [Oscillospiraceae bacterium]|nr:HAMP domain-containing histidine kinase [Oscillospiraceae bacterium]
MERGVTVSHKFGIRKRLFLQVASIIVMCLVAIAVVNSQLLETAYMKNLEYSFKNVTDDVEKGNADYKKILSEYEAKHGVSIDLYDINDNYLYRGSSRFISGNKLNVISRKDYDDGSYFNVVSEEGSTYQYIIYGKDFADGRRIEITAQKDPIRENANFATRVTTFVTVIALFVALVLVSLYAKRFTKPLIEMSRVTNKLAELDFSTKCEIKRKDEIGTLAENINTLSESLDKALTELREKNEQLLEDIERERQIEKMRSDFVASASHELKTPIAVIRGYAEMMKMSTNEEDTASHECCDIIINEADKMNVLVLNMLEQSMYSSGMKKPNLENFSVNEFVTSFLKTCSPIFEEKEIEATYRLLEDVTVSADKNQMTTVLSNIVLNACSHARGEKKIIVSTELLKDKVKVNVFNTGSFVDDKDKDSIFTSFYRADKSHSRAEGRFGLGLSIVKSITENHGCECGFENCKDGVIFWFTMGLAQT